MSELSILQAFVAAGMTPVGACAMGGNIQAESGFKANIAQRGMTKLTDEEYTAAADSGQLGFANDAVGYGLCQWTYPTRKAALREYARNKGTSVGDEQTQVQFCVSELKNDYLDLWGYLCETQDLSGAAGRICTEYERPSANNMSVRTMYANRLYMQYGAELMHNAEAGTAYKKTALDFAMPIIKRGDRSPEAHYLRKILDNLGYDTVWDGLWAALVDYQGKRGLTVDGVCGKQTWAKLMQEGRT